MVQIKLIALDLDGTLLDSRKRLSSRNESVLKACIRRGIEIVPCTGRIWSAVPEFIRNLSGIRYAITTNGAMVQDIVENRILDERKLSSDLALEILELAKSFHTMYDAYIGGTAFGEARFLDHMDEFGVSAELQKMVRETRRPVPDVIEEVRRQNRQVEKINYFFGNMAERQRAREALLKREDIIVSSSLPNNLEINALGATKGEAILRLAKHLEIQPEQTMGLGDGENDVTMMQMAGISVAMGNSLDILKAEADYVTDTNDEDGVAVAIEKLIFGIED